MTKNSNKINAIVKIFEIAKFLPGGTEMIDQMFSIFPTILTSVYMYYFSKPQSGATIVQAYTISGDLLFVPGTFKDNEVILQDGTLLKYTSFTQLQNFHPINVSQLFNNIEPLRFVKAIAKINALPDEEKPDFLVFLLMILKDGATITDIGQRIDTLQLSNNENA